MRSRSRLTSHQSKKFIEQNKYRNIATIVLVLLCISLWLYSFSAFTYLRALTIDDVVVYGAEDKIVEPLKAVTLQSLTGTYLGIFSRANVLIYPKSQVTKAIKSGFPIVKSLTVKRDGLHGLMVNVIQKEPKALVCITLPDFSQGGLMADSINSCYLADATGLIIDDANALTSIANLNRYYTPSLADNITSEYPIIGSLATSSSKFVELQNFYNGARNAGLDVHSILIKEGGEYEMYVDNIVIYFNDLRSFDEQLLNLISFWNRLVVNKEEGDKSSEFESIDVRYGSNVFYRKIK